MKLKRHRYLRTVFFTFFAIACGFANVARAQIGSGWSSYYPTNGFIDYMIDHVHNQHPVSSFNLSSMYFTKSGRNLTFGLKNSHCNRVEHDTNDHYSSGKRQFQGYLRIYPGISEQSVLQIFEGTSGPVLMLKGYGRGNGTLKKQGGAVTVASNLFGKTIRVNVVHDLNNNGKLTVYINGAKKWGGIAKGSSYNLKYGLYGTLNSPTKTQWRNVKFFR